MLTISTMRDNRKAPEVITIPGPHVVELPLRPLGLMQFEERRRKRNLAFLPRQAMRAGSCIAEIVADRRANPAVYHVLVQRDGSNEVLLWAQYHTQGEAERAAKAYVEECAATAASHHAAQG